MFSFLTLSHFHDSAVFATLSDMKDKAEELSCLAQSSPASRCLCGYIMPQLGSLELELFSITWRVLRVGNVGSKSLTHAQWAWYHWATASAPWQYLRLPLEDLLELYLLSSGGWIGAQLKGLKINPWTCRKPTLESWLIPCRHYKMEERDFSSNSWSPWWMLERFLKCYLL